MHDSNSASVHRVLQTLLHYHIIPYRASEAHPYASPVSFQKYQAWYRKKNMLGMMLYIDNFAGNLRGVKGKLKYLEECGVNCVHLMPFLDSPKGRFDGGYAVA